MLLSYVNLIIQVLLVADAQLRDLSVLAGEHLSRVRQDLDVALLGSMLFHALQEGVAHCTDVRALDRGVGGCLVVFAAGVHPDVLLPVGTLA
jgi:hypothetical protein